MMDVSTFEVLSFPSCRRMKKLSDLRGRDVRIPLMMYDYLQQLNIIRYVGL